MIRFDFQKKFKGSKWYRVKAVMVDFTSFSASFCLTVTQPMIGQYFIYAWCDKHFNGVVLVVVDFTSFSIFLPLVAVKMTQ